MFPQDDDNDLVSISDYITQSVGLSTERAILSASIITPLNDMMDAFHEQTNITNVVIRSAFRSMSGQQQIFDNMVRRWGRTGALRWAARPGHSEHHTGLAFDFGIMRSGQVEVFEGTGSYNWIPRNSHSFGFILRYPSGKIEITETNFEPWHYRYVGIPHASIMRANNWVLEEYIEKIREYTFEEPLSYTVNDIEYQVYFTLEMEVRLPYDVDFNISGNNIDGFIVTYWESPDIGDVEFSEV
jgi:D-alanyl-D-alanine carboxypeptidase